MIEAEYLFSETDSFFVQYYRRINSLIEIFGTYATGISIIEMKRFFSQFNEDHMLVVLRMLEHIDYYSTSRQISLIKDLAKAVKVFTNQELDDVLFCPILSYSGSRADYVQNYLKHFLKQSAHTKQDFNKKFIRYTDLAKLEKSTDKQTIVFVDDFIGSGRSLFKAWEFLKFWENDYHDYVFGVLVGYADAITKLKKETYGRFDIIAINELPVNSKAFHEDNEYFSDDEKDVLKHYCEKIPSSKKEHTYGYMDTQSLVIFQERAPNNSLPILHSKNNWEPLFKRLI